ncbi:hypothetical protein EST38_g5172 [Candolleomyces aberdarensis]|uniref:Glycoside hydrolase family 5 domain-containing protein n=1 Tax=Candolleomyces aberdarensis TaxID=2316362 RepID=A0A4Q2DKN5_9AGAR|nr:hypothetical protein EST38_g5172 [Candolleomyces aberdarensis]
MLLRGRMLSHLIFLLLIHAANAIVLRSSGRWILDASTGQRVKLRCANWAGHQEASIPEGLQHQPAANIAQWLSTNRFNCVRLTFSIDMALGNPNQRVSDSFTAAASAAGVSTSSMQNLYTQAVSKNSWLSSATTRVVAPGAAVQVMETGGGLPPPDNAGNSRFFDTNNWLSGLRSMASFAQSHPNVIGISLRNELRATGSQDGNSHADWYNFVTQGARAVREGNSNLLVVVGGVNYALDLRFIYNEMLDRNVFGDKLVWEFHNYQWSGIGSTCASHQKMMGDRAGYLLVQNKTYMGPLFLSEFGWAQNNPSAAENTYVSCLV